MQLNADEVIMTSLFRFRFGVEVHCLKHFKVKFSLIFESCCIEKSLKDLSGLSGTNVPFSPIALNMAPSFYHNFLTQIDFV